MKIEERVKARCEFVELNDLSGIGQRALRRAVLQNVMHGRDKVLNRLLVLLSITVVGNDGVRLAGWHEVSRYVGGRRVAGLVRRRRAARARRMLAVHIRGTRHGMLARRRQLATIHCSIPNEYTVRPLAMSHTHQHLLW